MKHKTITSRYFLLGTLALCLISPFAAAGSGIEANAPVTFETELDYPVLPAGETTRVTLKIRILPERIATAGRRPPVNLAIALDRSGSMGGERIRQAREAALTALERLRPEDKIALVAYADRAETLIESQHPRRREELRRIIAGIQARGMTALYDGVSQAAAQIRRGEGETSFNRILLISDGKANVGPSSTEDLRAFGRALAGEGISVSTIGIGAGFNEDLMTGLAESGEGNSYFVEDVRDLPRIFAAELEGIQNVAATEIEVVVRCAPGVRPIRVIGREGEVDSDSVRLQLRQVFGGQERFALIELEVDAGVSGETRELVTVQGNYTESVRGHRQQGQTQATVRFDESREAVRMAANERVAKDLVENRIAEEKLQVIALSDVGDHREAARRMRQLRQEVDGLNALYRSDRIEQLAEGIEAEASALDQSGLSPAARKQYRNSSYQTRTQQQSVD